MADQKKEPISEVDADIAQRRAEIELELEWLNVRERFVAAKANRDADPEEYATAKQVMSNMRRNWRAIGEAVGKRHPVGPIAVTMNQTEA